MCSLRNPQRQAWAPIHCIRRQKLDMDLRSNRTGAGAGRKGRRWASEQKRETGSQEWRELRWVRGIGLVVA